MSKKRDDITAAAERLLYREGFGAVGIDRIVGEADVALGTLYRHFPHKEDVIVAALLHREAAYLAALEGEPAQPRGAEAVLSLFDRLLAWAEESERNGCFFLRAAGEHAAPGPIREVALAHKQRMLRLIAARLGMGGWDGVAADRLAPAIFVLLEGAVAAAFTLGDRRAVAAAKDTADLLLANDSGTSE